MLFKIVHFLICKKKDSLSIISSTLLLPQVNILRPHNLLFYSVICVNQISVTCAVLTIDNFPGIKSIVLSKYCVNKFVFTSHSQ